MILRGASAIGLAAAAYIPPPADPVDPPGDLPLWRQGQAVNEWREISGTSLSTHSLLGTHGTDYPQGKIDAWCGMAIDLRTLDVYSPGNGGHDNYHGNEVDRLRLSDNAPAWVQVAAPSSLASVTFDQDYYTDGRPASHHTYYCPVVIESINRVLRFPSGSRATSGFVVNAITAFNIGGDWDNSSSAWPGLSTPGGGIGAGEIALARHPDTDAVYCWITNAGIYRWNPGVPGSWTTLGAGFPPVRVNETAAAVDATRGQVFFLGGGSGGDVCHRYNIVADSIEAITLTGTDIKSENGIGLAYIPEADRYYACIPSAGGSSVYVITPGSGTSWACSALSTTGGGSLPATNGGIGEDKPFSKFLGVPALGGCFFYPRFASNAWFLRVV